MTGTRTRNKKQELKQILFFFDTKSERQKTQDTRNKNKTKKNVTRTNKNKNETKTQTTTQQDATKKIDNIYIHTHYKDSPLLITKTFSNANITILKKERVSFKALAFHLVAATPSNPATKETSIQISKSKQVHFSQLCVSTHKNQTHNIE